MKPTDAYAHIAQRKTERVEIDHLEGRITVGLVTPYPPGIPLLIPGEVFNRKIVDYLLFAREFAKECPGFETDIHGLVELQGEDGEVRYYADCVAGTAPARKTPAGGKPAVKKAVKTAAKPAAKAAAKTVAKAAAKPAAKPAAKLAKAAAVTGVKAPAKRPAARKAQPAAPEVGTAAKPARGRKMVQVGDDGPFGRTI
jgi:ornithine decarboxylase/arginine decarboxylase